MLTGDLVRPRLRKRGDQLQIDWLPANLFWQQTAADLIALFHEQIGQPRHVWDTALEAYEGERTDYIVLRGLAKVLSDAATFTPIDTPWPPEELRQHVFALGPVLTQTDLFHPQSRQDVLQTLADDLGVSVDQLEIALFADRPAEYLLVDAGPDWTPEALIARYNLELARGVLYWANQMTIQIHDNYKDFWRYLKLFKLMFWASPLGEGGYQVVLDGPISPFVHATTRYGRQFAAFLPALLLGQRWQMHAEVRAPQFDTSLEYYLDDTTPLRAHFKRSGVFDSQLEADFAAEFATKFGEKRGSWLLTREDEVLLLGDTVMIPDFALTHKKDGRRVLIEIVGFWHPDYLRRKVEKVRAANRSDLLLLVYEGVNLAETALQDIPSGVLYFKNKPVLKDVMAMVEAMSPNLQ
jgi:predicted nuclease of restriction endonuclease-like RecB superfamily